jgi:hypothetical protein
MFDLLASSPPPDVWPALALPLYGMGLSAVLVMLVVLLLVGTARPHRRVSRVRRLEGTRAA